MRFRAMLVVEMSAKIMKLQLSEDKLKESYTLIMTVLMSISLITETVVHIQDDGMHL